MLSFEEKGIAYLTCFSIDINIRAWFALDLSEGASAEVLEANIVLVRSPTRCISLRLAYLDDWRLLKLLNSFHFDNILKLSHLARNVYTNWLWVHIDCVVEFRQFKLQFQRVFSFYAESKNRMCFTDFSLFHVTFVQSKSFDKVGVHRWFIRRTEILSREWQIRILEGQIHSNVC